MYLPRLRSKTIPSQLKDLKAKAKENCIFISYRPHQDTEKHSLKEKLVYPKVILKRQIAKIIYLPTQSNSEDLSTARKFTLFLLLTSPVSNPKRETILSTSEIKIFLTIKGCYFRKTEKRIHCYFYGHYICFYCISWVWVKFTSLYNYKNKKRLLAQEKSHLSRSDELLSKFTIKAM